MPGFASTADFFEAHARREREPERRQRLLEAAGFYRSLAEIIPGIPAGYKSNGARPALSRAERWVARAEQCRTLADHLHDPDCRAKLIGLAETCEARAGDELNVAKPCGSTRVGPPTLEGLGVGELMHRAMPGLIPVTRPCHQGPGRSKKAAR